MKNKKNYNDLSYNLMIIPGIIIQFLFAIVPLIGIVMAFQTYNPKAGYFGSKWIGFENFIYMFQIPDVKLIFFNTVYLAGLKILFKLIISLIFALMLNEILQKKFKSYVQTIVYIPHFISWVLLAAIFGDIFSYTGIINNLIGLFGGEPIMFLQSNTWFRSILVFTDVWKEFGYGAIIYLAALTSISPELYESAAMDGATRFDNLRHITLPSITTTIILLLVLSIGDIMNANFDQVFNLYNPLVYKTSDIIDTYVYRLGLQNAQYGLATAVGLLKSGVSFILIVTSYKMAEKYANYRIF